ncbi:hypothetical protein NIASO_16020 [Niabella soli DSM 19437]|uniref:Uncharacterized protein n=1 Tax=Niabella soli DSM 19437 TaxID=929713 RepID=W0F7U5_9BACT|nr:hypothetical protein NIASO_16020 [Niabella soli DSM 19437]
MTSLNQHPQKKKKQITFFKQEQSHRNIFLKLSNNHAKRLNNRLRCKQALMNRAHSFEKEHTNESNGRLAGPIGFVRTKPESIGSC